MSTPFVLIRDFNFAGDDHFGVLQPDGTYLFGDGDAYTVNAIAEGCPSAVYFTHAEIAAALKKGE